MLWKNSAFRLQIQKISKSDEVKFTTASTTPEPPTPSTEFK
jgi:hypothetical protein